MLMYVRRDQYISHYITKAIFPTAGSDWWFCDNPRNVIGRKANPLRDESD